MAGPAASASEGPAAGAPHAGPAAVCALFDGAYHVGAAVLANSLAASGFRGTIWFGHRGPLPQWAAAATPPSNASGGPDLSGGSRPSLRLPGGPLLRFVALGEDGHRLLAWQKPHFMLRLLDELDPACGAAVYFDVDIVALSPWGFFEDWLRSGVGLCQDFGLPAFDAGHPFRRAWAEAARAAGHAADRHVALYVNSGYVGLPRAHRGLLETWRDLIDRFAAGRAGTAQALKLGTRADPFHATDQDLLNAALAASEAPLSVLGPEGMDFLDTRYGMSHSYQSPKPWAFPYVRQALRGFPPPMQHRKWWRFADGPLAPMPPAELARRRLAMRLASAIGRVYHRPEL